MRKIRLLNKWLYLAALLSGLVLPMQAANFNTNCLEAASPTTGYGCTANDASISDFQITWIGSGCVSGADRAEVKMAVTIDESTSRHTYNVGLFINTEGGTSAVGDNTMTTQCLHEALFPIGATVDKTSGTGPYLDDDGDSCGDIDNSVGTIYRKVVDGITTTEKIFTVACADNDGNGYVDFAWATGWATTGCTQISDAVANGKSKCASGTQDSYGTPGSIAIGIPDLTISISCTPAVRLARESTTCTATYSNANNANTGPASFIEFHLDYNETYGTVSGFDYTGPSPDNGDIATDEGGYINWIVDKNTTSTDRPTQDNIIKNQSGSFKFIYTVNSDYDDIERSVDFNMTAYFNNTGTGIEQPLTTGGVITLPVTVNYAYPQRSGNTIDIDFSTASETGNIGFNIYAVKGKKWTKLNTEIIPGSLDSFEPKDYRASVTIPEGLKVRKVGITGIDLNGVEDRHGPFKIGKESGKKEQVAKVDWVKVNKEVKADRKARKAAKKVARKATKIELRNQSIILNIPENAIYRVTHDDLMEAGINLKGQKAEMIAISFRGEGIARHIEGLNKKKRWTKNSWIEFAGTKPDATDALYVDASRYQLRLNKKLAIDSEAIEPMTAKEIVIDNNNRYAYTQLGDDPFYENMFYTLNESAIGRYTSRFDMPVYQEEGSSSLHIDTSVVTDGKHKMSVMLNGVSISDATIEGKRAWSIEAEVDNNLFKKTGNELSFALLGENDGWDIVLYDKMTIAYDDGEVVASQTPTLEVDDKIRKKDIKSKRGTNYVMIVHPLFMGATLDRYVKQREGEGWKIKVVNVEDIYAAYDNGMETPVAIKAYLKDAIKIGVTHVQLVGAASYDYHDYLGLGSLSFIPSLYALTNDYIKYTPCDACYVMGNDGLPSIAIGRWPVRTLGDFENVVNKTLDWKSSGQSSSNTALLIADEMDRGYDFAKQMETMAVKMEENGWNAVERVYLDEMIKSHDGDISLASSEAKEEVKKVFSEGVSVLSYSGHSSTSGWSSHRLLHQNYIGNIGNKGKTAIALPFACQATYADSPYINTMAHQLLAADENGAVAVYGAATWSSFADNGIALGKVLDGLMTGQTLGEAIKNSKQSLGSNYRDVIRNGNLIGDVTLELK